MGVVVYTRGKCGSRCVYNIGLRINHDYKKVMARSTKYSRELWYGVADKLTWHETKITMTVEEWIKFSYEKTTEEICNCLGIKYRLGDEKMSNMTAVEFLIEKGRMTQNCTIKCDKCGFNRNSNGKNVHCGLFQSKFPEEAVKILEEWIEKHPRKTILQDFLEKYPDAKLNENGVPSICPNALGYNVSSVCMAGYKPCYDCWNKPYGVY